ncbi:MAG: tetratricopeptide repeat protein [Cyanobacteria bacterium J06635_1]
MTGSAEKNPCFQSGRNLFEQGKYEEASKEFQQSVQSEPPVAADAYYWWGNSLLKEGKSQEASEKYQQAANLKFDFDAEGYFAWGKSFYEQNRFEEASEKFRQAEKSDPDLAKSYYWIGRTLVKLSGDTETVKKYKEEAVTKYRTAIKKYEASGTPKPDYADVYNYLGVELSNLGDYKYAIENFQISIKEHKAAKSQRFDYANTYFNLGLAFANLGQYEEAIAAYKKALQEYGDDDSRKDDYVDTCENIGLCLANLNKPIKEVEAQFQEALKLVDSRAKTYYWWGHSLAILNRYEDAVSKYKKATEINENDSDSYVDWGRALANLNRSIEDVNVPFERAVSNEGNDEVDLAKINHAWGICLAKINHYEEAFDKYKTALDCIGNSDNNSSYAAVIYNDWGVYLIDLNCYEDALKKYDQAIAIDSEFFDPLFNQGLCFHRINQNDAAIKKYEETIGKIEKASLKNLAYAYSLHDMADIYWQRGNYQKGYKKWVSARLAYKSDQAIDDALANRNSDYFLNYGDMLRKIFGDVKKAKACYLHALSLNSQHIDSLIGLVHVNFENKEKELSFNPNDFGRFRDFVSFELNRNKESGIRNQAHWDSRDCYKKVCEILKSQLKTLESRYAEKIQDKRHALTFERANKLSEIRVSLKLGKLASLMKDYEESEKYLVQALERYELLKQLNIEAIEIFKPSSAADKPYRSIDLNASTLAEIYSNLGVVYIRKNDLPQGTEYLETAHRVYSSDLSIWSSLAEAYLKLEKLEMAEAEFQKILKISPYHLESLIGLGETYVAMGDATDADFYAQAIARFSETIRLSKERNYPSPYQVICSKRLKNKELAAVYYSRGYARVQLYEKGNVSNSMKLLKEALEDFKDCNRYDPTNYKARRALEKVNKAFKASSSFQKITESLGPSIIFWASVVLFGLTQVGFLLGGPLAQLTQPKPAIESTESEAADSPTGAADPGEASQPNGDTNPAEVAQTTLEAVLQTIEDRYVLLTFGSLTFMAISLYLPQLLKIKIGDIIELEKSAVDQIETTSSLGISK